MEGGIKYKLKNRVFALAIVLISIIGASLFVSLKGEKSDSQSMPDYFVGVEYGYGDVRGISGGKELVNKVKDYTNLFVVGSPRVTFNQTTLNEVCDYVYEAGLYLIVHFTAHADYSYDVKDWIVEGKQKYGDKFLGVYYLDEPGGRQLDDEISRFVTEAEDYGQTAEDYVFDLYVHLERIQLDIRLLTADYGLYWFDYKAGYDTVLAEFGWNHSRQRHIGLCRGAADIQNKNWGVMITWTYRHPPYIESGEDLYDDMVLAYHTGAKYTVIFNYPQISRYGILTEEHFEAIERFWKYIQGNPARHGMFKGKYAYVLPQDYGFGFRYPTDIIWGIWRNESSKTVWREVNHLREEYGYYLDIVYDDPKFRGEIKNHYNLLFFCNVTNSSNKEE